MLEERQEQQRQKLIEKELEWIQRQANAILVSYNLSI
jgi:hypothetical protein